MTHKKINSPWQKNEPLSKGPKGRQDIDVALRNLTHIIEKDPKKAAEIFKNWLERPSKIIKPKRAA